MVSSPILLSVLVASLAAAQHSIFRQLGGPSNVCGPIEDNVDYYGNDIKSTAQSNPDRCCLDCQNTPNCKVYVWTDLNGGTCWLKSMKGPKSPKAGAKAGSLPATTVCGTLEDNTDYYGNDIKSTSQASADSCCGDCQNTPNCKTFVWTDLNGGTCWLKSSKGPKSSKAGAKAGSLPATTVCGALEDNTDYYGNDIKSTSQASADSCCGDCQNTPNCKVFVWTDLNGGTCWLKSSKGPKSSKVGAKAGSVPGSFDNCGQIEWNTDFVGQDIAKVNGIAVSDCCDPCRNEVQCNAYSWANGVCYLKKSRESTVGSNGVASVRVNKCSVMYDNVDYPGNDIGNVKGDKWNCCAYCRQKSGCKAFSWSNGVCYLKNAGGINSGVPAPGVFSGYI